MVGLVASGGCRYGWFCGLLPKKWSQRMSWPKRSTSWAKSNSNWRRCGMIIEDTLSDPRYWSEYELTIDIAGEVFRGFRSHQWQLFHVFFNNISICCFTDFSWRPSWPNQQSRPGNMHSPIHGPRDFDLGSSFLRCVSTRVFKKTLPSWSTLDFEPFQAAVSMVGRCACCSFQPSALEDDVWEGHNLWKGAMLHTSRVWAWPKGTHCRRKRGPIRFANSH